VVLGWPVIESLRALHYARSSRRRRALPEVVDRVLPLHDQYWGRRRRWRRAIRPGAGSAASGELPPALYVRAPRTSRTPPRPRPLRGRLRESGGPGGRSSSTRARPRGSSPRTRPPRDPAGHRAHHRVRAQAAGVSERGRHPRHAGEASRGPRRPPLRGTARLEDAGRGFLGTLPRWRSGTRRGAWSGTCANYAFLAAEAAPPTVNPSSGGRRGSISPTGSSRSGRIYQIRGFDISNMTLIEGREASSSSIPDLDGDRPRRARPLLSASRAKAGDGGDLQP